MEDDPRQYTHVTPVPTTRSRPCVRANPVRPRRAASSARGPGNDPNRPANRPSQPHLHDTQFQFVYVLKGWIEFEYEGQGVVRLEAGSSVYQPPMIRHRELGHSADVELLEIVMPGDFGTSAVDAVQPAAASR